MIAVSVTDPERMKRRPPASTEKIATLLHIMWELEGDPVPWEQQKLLEPWMTCALVEWHHTTPHSWTGSNHPTTLWPPVISAHRKVTAKQAPVLAKVRRSLRKRENVHRECTGPLKSNRGTRCVRGPSPARRSVRASRRSTGDIVRRQTATYRNALLSASRGQGRRSAFLSAALVTASGETAPRTNVARGNSICPRQPRRRPSS
jgi:hypothetical protein